MIVSPFTPIFFPPLKCDGIESRYMQTFATTDDILIEVLCDNSEEVMSGTVMHEPEHTTFFPIEFNQWQVNSSTTLYFATLNLTKGVYSVCIGDKCSTIFKVTDNEYELERTTLIQYSMNSNKHRKDAVFFIDGMQRFFDFRVPGGFKDSNWSFEAESEQFVTDDSDIIQLYGISSTQKKFTLGNSEGCPIWFAEMLNRILCCSYVYIDGERCARKGNSTPEITVLQEGLNSFVFTQNLQRVVNINPELTLQHQAIMRRVDTDNYRLASTNINRLIK